MVFEVRAEDKELTSYQRKFSMKEILGRLNSGGERSSTGICRPRRLSSSCHDLALQRLIKIIRIEKIVK